MVELADPVAAVPPAARCAEPQPISRAAAPSILRKALLSRFTEETLLDLFSQGLLHGTVHTCIGEELTGAVVSEHLQPGDTLFSNHRCHGHFVSRHGNVEGLLAELMGRRSGVSGGLGGSQHLYQDGFFSNGIQGGIVPVAAGLALGHTLRGTDDISVVFIGDGTLGEGAVYEALNLIAKWNLPLLVVLEDNQYSQSTAQHETLAGDIGARARAFGIETARADTWHWRALDATVAGLVAAMRRDRRPRFLHIETYRLKAHSKGDDSRPRADVAPYEQADPLNRYLQHVPPAEAAWVQGLRDEVAQAVERARQAPFAELLPLPADAVAPHGWHAAPAVPQQRLVTALNTTLDGLLRDHPEVFVMGEDVLSPYGGAFKVTKDLSDRYPGRVRNTPISEAGIVGMGAGLGLAPFHPIVEIMFGDFIGLGFDALVNHAAKFHQMYNGQVHCNLTVRTPMGGGRGYGPTHSQTLDRHFLGVPGLRVLAMNSLTTPEQLYRPLMRRDAGPTLVIENKLLYGSYLGAETPGGFELLHSDAPFPDAWLRPAASHVDITLLGYGGTCELLREACERLFEEHDVVAQVLSVMQIHPFRVAPLLPVLQAAPRLLIVEEGQGFAGFGAEVIGQLAEAQALDGLAVRRLHPAAHCIPSSGPLEKALLPSTESLVEAALKMMTTNRAA